jgi:MFS family permease
MATETLQSSARLGPRGRLVLLTLCGATFMTGLDYSIITVALPEIGRSLGFVVGTIGGGLITSGLNWRWTMLILFGIGSLVMLGAMTVVRESAGGSRARLDVPGAILASGGLFALVYGISTGDRAGWGSVPTLATLLAAVVLLGAFLFVEARHAAPLVPLRLLRRATVTWGMAVALVTFGMCGGATLLLSIHMQNVLGYSPLRTGFGFLGEGVAALLAGTLAARLISARGTVPIIVLGLTVQAMGTAAMVFLPAEGGLVLLLATSATMGFGHVLTVVAAVTTITSGLDEADQGVAGSLAQMPTFVGAVGVAGLTAIVAARTEALAPATTETLATLGGLHTAFLVAGVVALLGAVAGGVLLRRANTGRAAERSTGRPAERSLAS